MDFNFNSNRAEAERWLSTAVKLLSAHDLQGTKTFAIRARETDPRLEATDQIIAVADTLLAAESQINSQNQQPDWYAILQLAQYTQNLEIVATQYRRLALLLNPHRNRFPYADHAFRLVSEAWNVLSNPNKKAMYDHELSMFNRFDSPPSGSTQLFERQFLQMHHVQQQPPQPPPPPPPQPLLFHPQPSQLLQFQPQPPPPPQPQPEVQRPQPQWHFQQKRQPPPPPEHQHQQQQQNQQYHHEPPQQHRQQYQELPHLLQQQQQQQEVRKNPKSKDGRPSMEEERPNPIPINVTEPAPAPSESTPPPSKSTHAPSESTPPPSKSTHAPSESTGPVESTPPSESAPPSELTRPQTVSKSASFWTSCPYCYNLFEYPSVYEDCMLRCQNCKRAFNAMAIASPPLAGKGGDVNFCCWGYFPLGLLENGKDTGGSSGEWTPFSTMFACPIQGKKNTGRAKIANSGPRVYYDDEEALLDVSDPSEDSDDDEWQRVMRKKKAVKPRAKASAAKTPVRASDRIRKGSQNAGGQGKVGTGGGGGVGGGSVSKAESSKKSTSGARKRSAAALGKLDLNVEFSNNEVEEPAAQTMSEGNGTANGEEDNIEGIGFFEGLDEFLSSLPILNVVGDDKVKAN